MKFPSDIENPLDVLRSVKADMQQFQLDVLRGKEVSMQRGQEEAFFGSDSHKNPKENVLSAKPQENVPMKGAANLVLPSKELGEPENPIDEPPSMPIVYTITVTLRFNEYWIGGVPFGGPGPWLYAWSGDISFGQVISTFPVFYEISDYGVPATEEHYDAEMHVSAASPALVNDVKVTFSIETTDLGSGLASGSFLTGTYILPSSGATSNIISIDTPAGFGLRNLVGTHTGTIELI